MNPFNPMPLPTVISRFVVISEHGTRFTGAWPERQDAERFARNLWGSQVVEVEPYTVE